MQKDGNGGGGGGTAGRSRNMVWNNFGGNTPHHAFTTGRPHPQRSGGGGDGSGAVAALGGGGGGGGGGGAGGFIGGKVRPKGPSQTLKLCNVSETPG